MTQALQLVRAEPARSSGIVRQRGGILQAIGETPLVRFDKILLPRHWTLYAKLEALNPAGSAKDRPALWAIEEGLRSGRIGQDTVVVESSSGNMGIGLSQVCCYFGLKLICVVDPCTTLQNLRLMRAYGTSVEVVQERDLVTGSYLPTRLKRVQEILREEPKAFWVNQYENPSCVSAHQQSTAPDIVRQLGRFPDYFVCSVGTCATLQGCAAFFREMSSETKIVAVDSEGSVILGGEARPRTIPGVGSAQKSSLLEPSLIDIPLKIAEEDSVHWCRQLARTEAVLLGGSSGTVLAGIERICDEIPANASVVALLHDRGERYLDTIYDDANLPQEANTARLSANSTSAALSAATGLSTATGSSSNGAILSTAAPPYQASVAGSLARSAGSGE